jgi:Rod binding domain-containing protein
MIVTPTQDVVLDVLEAADPVAQRAATAKLEALKSPGVDFSATMAAEAGRTAAAEGLPSAVAPTRVIKAAGSGEVYRKFEAFVLQVFVETMLPQNAQDLFGKGTAGGIWRSMLAEQLGNQLAQGKGIGIARQLAAAHPAATDGGPAEAG